MLDVGANNGSWSVQLSQFLPRAEFHLFECAPYCFDALDVLPIPSATINKVAVSEQGGEIELFLPKVGSGLASNFERRDTSVRKHDYDRIMVPCTTLDEYLKGIAKDVDLLKIDVEGSEMTVLHGAKDSMDRISAVMFEFGSANINSRTFFLDFWDFFTLRGFVIKRFIPSGHLIGVESYDDSLEYFRGASNYLAIKE